MIGTITLYNDKKLKEIRRFNMSKFDKIIETFKVTMDMAEDIKAEDLYLSSKIQELEERLSVNVMQRFIFLDQLDIPFNVVKGKSDVFNVSYSNESAYKYCKFLKTLIPVVEE